MKLWYCKPGHDPVECWTDASEYAIKTSAYIIIRTTDPYYPGVREYAVPSAYLIRSDVCPLTRTALENTDAIWDEVYTKAGYMYGGEEEANARAWFELGLQYQKKRL